jgi:hypothetical protein
LHGWKRKLNAIRKEGGEQNAVSLTLIAVLHHSARELHTATHRAATGKPIGASNDDEDDDKELLVSLFYLDADGDRIAVAVDRDLDEALKVHSEAGCLKLFASVSSSLTPSLYHVSSNAGSGAGISGAVSLPVMNNSAPARTKEERDLIVGALTDWLAIALVSMDVDGVLSSLGKEQIEAALRISDQLKQARATLNQESASAPAQPASQLLGSDTPIPPVEAASLIASNAVASLEVTGSAVSGRSEAIDPIALSKGDEIEVGGDWSMVDESVLNQTTVHDVSDTIAPGNSAEILEDVAAAAQEEVVSTPLPGRGNDKRSRWAQELQQLHGWGFWNDTINVDVLNTLANESNEGEEAGASSEDGKTLVLRVVEELLNRNCVDY